MQDKILKIVIAATTKGVQESVTAVGSAIKSGFDKGKEAVSAFNDAIGNGHKAIEGMGEEIKRLAAGFVSFEALKKAVEIMGDGEKAAFKLQTSIAAANREFTKTGSVDSWETAISNLSKELRIYSESDLKNAASRTLDLTKRMGLSKDQMIEVIRRSSDLGKGNLDLTETIQKVSMGMNGQVRAVRSLGLNLSDNYVKAQYNANAANTKSWESLTDLEKVQQRYQSFLKQTEAMLGSTAESTNTFAGAMKEVKAQITDTVENSASLKEALANLAETLKENKTNIGNIIATLVDLAAKLIEVGTNYKGWIAAIVGTWAAFSIIKTAIGWVTGLNAAFTAIMGMGFIPWIKDATLAITALAGQAGIAGIAIRLGLAGAAAWGTLKIIEAIKAFIDWRTEAKNVQAQQEELGKTTSAQMKAREGFKDFKLPGDITKTAQDDLENFRMSLVKARGYYMAFKIQLEQYSKDTFLGFATITAMAAQKKLKTVNERLKEIQNDFKVLGGSATDAAGAMNKPVDVINATKEQLNEFEKAAKTAYNEAKKSAADYAQRVVDFQQKIKLAAISTDDKLREIGRKDLDAAQKSADIKLQAEQRLSDAKKALAKGDYDIAEKLAKDSEKLYAEYAQSVIAWEDKIKYAKLSTADKIRELGRLGVTEEQSWADKKLEAEQKFYAAKQAMAEGDYELADKLAKEAESLYANLAVEVKGSGESSDVVVKSLQETKQIAIDGVKAVGSFVQDLYGKQKDAAQETTDTAKKGVTDVGAFFAELYGQQKDAAAKAAAEWKATADGIKKQLDEIATQREAKVNITLEGLEAAANAINNLTKDETKKIHIVTTTEPLSESGSSDMGTEGFATGGGLPGYGGGDRIRALLEAGEFIVRKEAVKKYGANLFHGLNAMRVNLPGMVRAKVGGLISNMSMPEIPRFAAGGAVLAAGTGGETMTLTFQAGNTEMPLRVMGSNKVTRGMVKDFEKELVKMGLSRR